MEGNSFIREKNTGADREASSVYGKKRCGCPAVLTVEAAFVVSMVIFSMFGVIMLTLFLRDTAAGAAEIRLAVTKKSAVTYERSDRYPVFVTEGGSMDAEEGSYYVELSELWPFCGISSGEEVRREYPDEPLLIRRMREGTE